MCVCVCLLLPLRVLGGLMGSSPAASQLAMSTPQLAGANLSSSSYSSSYSSSSDPFACLQAEGNKTNNNSNWGTAGNCNGDRNNWHLAPTQTSAAAVRHQTAAAAAAAAEAAADICCYLCSCGCRCNSKSKIKQFFCEHHPLCCC